MRAENEIRKMIRERIESGRIANEATVWGGPCSGMMCAACDERIEEGGELEVLGVDGQRCFYHAACYMVLTTERARTTSSSP